MLRRTVRDEIPAACEERSGIAIVELAVVLPVFMLIVMGIAEMSRALEVSEKISSAIRQGARTAAAEIMDVLPTGWTANQKVDKDIRNLLIASGVDASKIDIKITHADGPDVGKTFDLQDRANYLKYYRITASVDYKDVGLFAKFMAGKRIYSTVVFRLGRTSLSS
ncbi:TadE family protein [Planctomicrobium sp. SH668]|uniref:TadE family protein n=1 Tax=Planctomicrobium sp. SH668 TaxID=3448126 RepID=UPI003F5B9E0F